MEEVIEFNYKSRVNKHVYAIDPRHLAIEAIYLKRDGYAKIQIEASLKSKYPTNTFMVDRVLASMKGMFNDRNQVQEA